MPSMRKKRTVKRTIKRRMQPRRTRMRPRTRRTRPRKTRTRTRTPKYKNMKGCYKEWYNKLNESQSLGTKGGYSEPIGAYPIKGGQSPFVGSPYSVDSGGNYYKPQTNFSLDRQQILRGGNGLSSFMPTNLLNVGRMIEHNGQSIYNGLAGFKPPESPLPYQGQGRFNAN